MHKDREFIKRRVQVAVNLVHQIYTANRTMSSLTKWAPRAPTVRPSVMKSLGPMRRCGEASCGCGETASLWDAEALPSPDAASIRTLGFMTALQRHGLRRLAAEGMGGTGHLRLIA